jgi:major membrane immunogen (membrane-anchored lipoprotein)
MKESTQSALTTGHSSLFSEKVRREEIKQEVIKTIKSAGPDKSGQELYDLLIENMDPKAVEAVVGGRHIPKHSPGK